ncbi:MAG: adenosylmethionine--8-amino-7-oxononanoate transaminase [Gammaproteobacteria bacterium]|nr:MAG: adenosylmethionine--8-amino-7-oxononanoate transaminase [Gammaproteobacteria bacterium]
MKNIDQNHIWHPYSAMNSDLPVYEVESADGVRLKLKDGRELIDGMSSWWCMIHGYNHPKMNAALEHQIKKMSHVMFGGLTHQPAIELTKLLIEITPEPLQNIFYSDSGSVAVEVAMKIAIQYWHAKDQANKQRFISLRSAYHGDTFAAMSVSDPETGMHSLFKDVLAKQLFIKQPTSRFGEPCSEHDIDELEEKLKKHANKVAALIIEPIVQGAGGMWFYSADYLKHAKLLCKKYNVLLILDEIATGFGRTGKLFACEHAGISPDIMCIGKALTGGYLTLAATLTTDEISSTIDKGKPGVFMHGPTFMANPLACTAALTSTQLLLNSDWQENIKRIKSQLTEGLEVCNTFKHVKEIRVLGAIGVVEMKQAVEMKKITKEFVDAGVWIRPFGKLIYLMPPYVINKDDLNKLIKTVVNTVKNYTT